MGAYQYVAVDLAGKEHKGVLEGDTPRHVRQLLRERNFCRSRSTRSSPRKSARSRRFDAWGRGIATLDLALITRQLATLLNARACRSRRRSPQSASRPRSRGSRASFSACARKSSKVIRSPRGSRISRTRSPIVYRATVAAGEQAGQLDAVLERLADYTESRHGLRQKVSQALVYPIVLTVLSLAIVIFMLVARRPEGRRRLRDSGQELPLLTRALIGLSDFMVSIGGGPS